MNASAFAAAPCTRRGVTLVEMLVSLGVIGLLMSLLLPAVQSARETARQTQCRNNLHQIGIALHSFHDEHGYLPVHKPLTAFLPYMDARPLQEEFERLTAPNPTGNQGFISLAGLITPGAYICPSDPLIDAGRLQFSYGMSSSPSIGGESLAALYRNSQRRLRDVSDGLSNTAAFSEAVAGLRATDPLNPATDAECRRHPLRCYWVPPRNFDQTVAGTIELARHSLAADVRQAATPTYFFPDGSLFDSRESFYNHLVPPNNWPFVYGSSIHAGIGPRSPSSQHAGGAHVLFLDGSVHFISNHIDMEAFWALGTINGGESVTP